ncbi:hypothetical protein [Gandjariella thermophila]|uniref:Uncharacterized protein n=1 Tax=Gandjariella thermophila TaxID=1931992 RepID=A0A4D4J845_9PSEU|nr:hypothetical protein [Gandjariella thermophila]GDY31694.1 hypothetical protein GTS_33270 [Gandjariella thermophila]
MTTRDVTALQRLPEVDDAGPAPAHAICIPPTCLITGCRATGGTWTTRADPGKRPIPAPRCGSGGAGTRWGWSR